MRNEEMKHSPVYYWSFVMVVAILTAGVVVAFIEIKRPDSNEESGVLIEDCFKLTYLSEYNQIVCVDADGAIDRIFPNGG